MNNNYLEDIVNKRRFIIDTTIKYIRKEFLKHSNLIQKYHKIFMKGTKVDLNFKISFVLG